MESGCQECPEGQFNKTGMKRTGKPTVKDKWKAKCMVGDVLSGDDYVFFLT
jgi:hypothetical protein